MSTSGDEQLKVLIAVDFGTTFSALCWTLYEAPKEDILIQQWPGDYASHNKVPTTLLYKPTGAHQWGYQIRGSAPRHEWFKLGIDPEAAKTGLAEEYPSATALPQMEAAENEKLVVDYLTSLRKHAEKVIESSYGTRLFQKTSREYIITVPAVWSEKAQAATQAYAKKAGMGHEAQIITEPEAAGIYALAHTPTMDLKINDTFILCDAGGGTVDLVSYTINKLKPVPSLVEATRGSGDLCGSTFLNRIFAKHLSKKLRDYQEWDDRYQADALKEFEDDIKKNFDGDTSQTYIFPARGLENPELGIKDGMLELPGKEIKAVFDPVVNRIISLVTEQIRNTKKDVKAVLMAGGFGSSSYLCERIENAVKRVPENRKIEFRKVTNGETAIVRGALIRGLSTREPGAASIVVESRRSRRHYGTMAYESFDERKHDMSKKEPSPFSNMDRVKAMQWLIYRDTDVEDTKPIATTKEFWWDKRVLDGRPTVVQMQIYASEEPQAPVHPGEGVFLLADMEADITSIPESHLMKVKGTGNQMYYKIPYKLKMMIHSGRIEFSLLIEGQSYKATKVDFE